MYAVIQNGAHQYRVQPGDFIRVEKIKLSVGESWKCSEVLAFQDKKGLLITGKPFVEKAEIRAQVIRHGKSKKKLVFKKKRRKGYRKTRGHRQEFTELYICAFRAPDGETLEKPLKKKSPPPEQESAPAKEKAKEKAKEQKSA